jgi:hypothetical protein
MCSSCATTWPPSRLAGRQVVAARPLLGCVPTIEAGGAGLFGKTVQQTGCHSCAVAARARLLCASKIKASRHLE